MGNSFNIIIRKDFDLSPELIEYKNYYSD
jgi:hypothetical protein